MFPCMTMYRDKLYSGLCEYTVHMYTLYSHYALVDNASRDCLSTGVWSNLTNYTMCRELCVEVDTMNQTIYGECEMEQEPELDISLYVYFAGIMKAVV